jgi:hypothetical protein
MDSMSRRPNPLILIALAAVLVGGGLTAWRMRAASAVSPGVVTLSGRIEGDDSAVASRVPGRPADRRA